MGGVGFRVNHVFVFSISSVPDFTRRSNFHRMLFPGLLCLWDWCVFSELKQKSSLCWQKPQMKTTTKINKNLPSLLEKGTFKLPISSCGTESVTKTNKIWNSLWDLISSLRPPRGLD